MAGEYYSNLISKSTKKLISDKKQEKKYVLLHQDTSLAYKKHQNSTSAYKKSCISMAVIKTPCRLLINLPREYVLITCHVFYPRECNLLALVPR